MKRLLCNFLMLFAFVCMALALPIHVHAAQTLSFQLLDGTVVNPGSAVTTDSADFSAVPTAPELAGDTVICYLYDACREATTPADLAASGRYSDGYTVTVLTDHSTDAHGTLGTTGAKWILNDNTLIITGPKGTTVTDAFTGAYARFTSNRTDAHTGSSFAVKEPEVMYGDIENEGYGVHLPAVGDERTLVDNFYEYTKKADDIDKEIADRTDIVVNGIHYYRASTSGPLDPDNVGWFAHAGEIQTIFLSDDLKFTGNLGFFFNANLTAIDLGSGTGTFTMPGHVDQSAYTALRSVYLFSDLSGVNSTAGMFARCPELRHVYARHEKASPLTANESTAFMFYGDDKLVIQTDSFVNAMDLSSGSLLNTSYMFAGCSSMETPNVKDYNMSNVTVADGMFYGAKKAGLVAVSAGAEKNNIYGWDLGNLLSANFMFAGNLPQTGGVDDLDEPQKNVDPGFNDIAEASTLNGGADLSHWGLAKLITSYFMFAQDTALTGVTLGNSFPELIDASGMFLRADNLRNVVMTGCSTPKLKFATAMFKGAGSTSKGGSVGLSNWSCPALENTDFMFEQAGFSTIDLNGSSDFSTVTEAIAMFADNASLASLGTDALSHVRFTALTNASFMFSGDSALSALSTASWGMGYVEDISFMLNGCENLTSGVDVVHWEMGAHNTGAKNFHDMQNFAYKTSISLFQMGSWKMDYVTNMSFAFASNPKLTSVTLPGHDTALNKVVSTFGMFAECPKLTTVQNLKPAPALVDCRGMFYIDSSLVSIGDEGFVRPATKYASFMFQGCSAIEELTLNWYSTALEYMEGIFDGATSLKTITTGDLFTVKKVKSMGASFRDCHKLATGGFTTLLQSFDETPALEDCYEMAKNCYGITTLDLSEMDFSKATDLRRIAAMEENADYTTNLLTTIKVPASFMSAPGLITTDTSDGNGASINMFWVDGDGAYDGKHEEDKTTDDLKTTFFYKGNSLPAPLASYVFGGTNGDNDNRTFMTFNKRTINDKDTGSYTLNGTSDQATLHIDADTSFYVGGTTTAGADALPISYSWTRKGKVVADALTDTWNVTSENSGTYVASATPKGLAKDNAPAQATFIVGVPIVSLKATYTGDTVPVSTNYSKDDVIVTATDADGHEVSLSSSDFEVNSLKVTKEGENTFTVSYKTVSDVIKADFTVPGKRVIGSIRATYNGPAVLVGNEYDPSYVQVKAYYLDDTSKKDGFEVSPTSFSGTRLTKIGDNSFTAKYTDPNQDGKEFKSNFNVSGYKTVSSINATYSGDKIKVGNEYNKDKVTVTVYYADGTSSTVKDFTVDSKNVSREGDNSFVATYRDPFGNSYSDGFTVVGYEETKIATGAAISGLSAPLSTGSPVAIPPGYIYPIQTAGNAIPTGVTAGTAIGTSTGIVRTGTTEMADFYTLLAGWIIILAAVLVGVVLIVDKKGKEDA